MRSCTLLVFWAMQKRNSQNKRPEHTEMRQGRRTGSYVLVHVLMDIGSVNPLNDGEREEATMRMSPWYSN